MNPRAKAVFAMDAIGKSLFPNNESRAIIEPIGLCRLMSEAGYLTLEEFLRLLARYDIVVGRNHFVRFYLRRSLPNSEFDNPLRRQFWRVGTRGPLIIRGDTARRIAPLFAVWKRLHARQSFPRRQAA